MCLYVCMRGSRGVGGGGVIFMLSMRLDVFFVLGFCCFDVMPGEEENYYAAGVFRGFSD